MTGRPDKRTWQSQSLAANRRVRYFFTRHTRWLGSAESDMDDLEVIEKMRLRKPKKLSQFLFSPWLGRPTQAIHHRKCREFSRGENNEQSKT